MRGKVVVWAIVLAVAAASVAFGEEAPSRGMTVYVPVYPSVFIDNRGMELTLTNTLFIRNIDPARSLTVASVELFDERGVSVKKYVTQPFELPPLAAANYLLGKVKYPNKDSRAGSFLVVWQAEKPVIPPIVESVMISAESTQGISFIHPGKPTRPR